MAEEQKFPSEVIDLPSEGRLYPKESPLSGGKIELKYMTAREEDILTSANLIKKGVVIDKLLDSLILTEGINSDDLVLGDKNAVMVAARVLAYGPEYSCEVTNPKSGEKFQTTVNLADCPFKKVPDDVKSNNFKIELPISKKSITFKILSGREEKLIDQDLKSTKKIGTQVSPELTTRLRYTITSVDGDDNQSTINSFSQNMLARDSLFLRQEINRVSPDIEMSQEIELGGESVMVNIPMAATFFWPNIET
jgi:hypothetical protein